MRLLRILQQREVTRRGTTVVRKTGLRIVAATNRVLPLGVRNGRFREDLFHRPAAGVPVLYYRLCDNGSGRLMRWGATA
ncbi:MAG TPA: sigma 54-interacting transcriptional regulator [Burkholderiales bacterium]|nr:sigma 54-interacting transcriptional regulator [Burkholderiales bacterium]